MATQLIISYFPHMFLSTLGTGTPPSDSDLCIPCSGPRLLARANDTQTPFPCFAELGPLRKHCEHALEIGELGGKRLFALGLPPKLEDHDIVAPLISIEARSLLTVSPAPVVQALCLARELLWWHDNFRHCGRCGELFESHPTERAKRCPACQNVLYPVMVPAIIVAVRKGDTILLAHNKNFPGNRHSIVAGFVEVGETLEQAVAREVREETGIEVHNIRYHSSQPWPFPNSLMLGFTADWLSGEATPDGIEISHLGWFRAVDALPELPPPGSIAHRLITEALGLINV